MRKKLMENLFKYETKDFGVSIFRKSEEKSSYIAKIFTNFDEKKYFNNDIEVLISLLKNEINMFGKVLKISTDNFTLEGDEIESLIMKDTKYLISTPNNNVEILMNECDMQFSFFDEDCHKHVITEFNNKIDIFFDGNLF